MTICRLSRRFIVISGRMASGGEKRKSTDSNGNPSKKPAGPWNMGLKASMKDPELQVYSDDQVVIIKDKYPKAKHHFLVLPHQEIKNLKALNEEHIPLLKHMEKVGRAEAEKCDSPCEFRYGYHAIPSMSHVHLHVISQDFDSPCLKTKKHWNSFTSEYFMDSSDIIDMLEGSGKVQVDSSKFEEMLKRGLKCHRCSKNFTTMPALKKHLLLHIPKKK